MKTTAIIPAFNEEDCITSTISGLLQIPELDTVLVVDDGSTDSTGKLAAQAGAEVIRLSRNSGKGAALNAGWRSAADGVLLLVDADLGASAAYTRWLLPPVYSQQADMTVARFAPVERRRRAGFGLAVGTARLGIRLLTGCCMTAPLSGQRAMRSSLLPVLGGFAEGFGAEVALTVSALRAGFTLAEIPLPLQHRMHGWSASACSHRASQLQAVVRALYREWRSC